MRHRDKRQEHVGGLPTRRSWPYYAGAVLLGGLLLSSCGPFAYYAQSLWGGAKVLAQRRPVGDLLSDPATPAELQERLRLAVRIRDFASSRLALPDNASYRTYSDLGRPNAVWNVVAAPELQVSPLTWCFPVAGCVSYRGYFSESRARRFAERLRRRRHDVAVEGVSAYSTLGWFADPLLSTFIRYSEPVLAGLLFHELAHQVAYAPDDTTFNESFATTVERAGVVRWLAESGRSEAVRSYLEGQRRETQFTDLLLEYRNRLAALYATARPPSWKRSEKERLFAELRSAYGHLRESWEGDTSYDGWFERPLNNAHLASIGAYHALVPAFEALLQREGGDLARFYEETRRLADLPPEPRAAALETLVPGDSHR